MYRDLNSTVTLHSDNDHAKAWPTLQQRALQSIFTKPIRKQVAIWCGLPSHLALHMLQAAGPVQLILFRAVIEDTTKIFVRTTGTDGAKRSFVAETPYEPSESAREQLHCVWEQRKLSTSIQCFWTRTSYRLGSVMTSLANRTLDEQSFDRQLINYALATLDGTITSDIAQSFELARFGDDIVIDSITANCEQWKDWLSMDSMDEMLLQLIRSILAYVTSLRVNFRRPLDGYAHVFPWLRGLQSLTLQHMTPACVRVHSQLTRALRDLSLTATICHWSLEKCDIAPDLFMVLSYRPMTHDIRIQLLDCQLRSTPTYSIPADIAEQWTAALSPDTLLRIDSLVLNGCETDHDNESPTELQISLTAWISKAFKVRHVLIYNTTISQQWISAGVQLMLHWQVEQLTIDTFEFDSLELPGELAIQLPLRALTLAHPFQSDSLNIDLISRLISSTACSQITKLSLTRCDPRTHSAHYLLRAARQLLSLQEVYFHEHYLATPEAEAALIELLSHATLRVLDIDFCLQRDDSMVRRLWRLLPDVQHLTTLRIHQSRLCDSSVKELAEVLGEKSLLLQQLSLAHNHITQHGARQLAGALRAGLQSNTFRLCLDYNRVSPDEVQAMHAPQLQATVWDVNWKEFKLGGFDGFDEKIQV